MTVSAVAEYIAKAPGDQLAALDELRPMSREACPTASETIGSSRFPVYSDADGNWIAGSATRKKGPMLCVMTPGVLDRSSGKPGPLRSGKSCVIDKPSAHLDADAPRIVAKNPLRDAAGF